MNMKMLSGVAVAAILAVTAVPQKAEAIPLVLDGGWQEFTFGGVGSTWSDSFTFTALSTVYLAVTDAFLSGDRFQFFANAVSIGLTSAPTTQGDQIGSNYDAAFADARWSSGQAALGPGSYTITGLTVASPFGAGGAAIQLSSQALDGPIFDPTPPIPLPAAGWLMIAGLGGLAALRRRRKAA